MALVTIKNARIGLRVHLLHPDAEYEIGPMNPAVGSEYYCIGYIESADDYGIVVRWKNGNLNVYNDDELLTVDKVDDDEGRCQSIW